MSNWNTGQRTRSYNVFDNLEILGEKFIRDMKRDLPPLIFQAAILNKRMRKIENGFYAAFEEKLHCYDSSDHSFLESLGYNLKKAQSVDCRHDGDIDKSKTLIIANDYNAAINSLACGQVIGKELRTLKSFFVKTPRKLKDVCEDWCDYYVYHPTKDVIFYYDSTAVYDSPLDAESFADTVCRVFTKRGWRVTAEYVGQPMKHTLKHMYIDLAFKGDDKYLFPTFNRHNNDYLILAMEQAGVKIGRNGFEKDKSPEKEADTPENPDEQKTHITDAWDTLFIGTNFYPVIVDSGVSLGSVYG